MTEIFIPLLSLGVGGAELRFADIAEALSARGTETSLVIPATLKRALENVRPNLPSNTVVLGKDGDSLPTFLFKYLPWVRQQSSGSPAFHYPLNCLPAIHAGLSHHVTGSYTDSIPISKRKMSWTWQIRMRNLLRGVKGLDVLNPSIFNSLQNSFPRAAQKLSLTPSGTFVNPISYGIGAKSTEVAFVSRLVPELKGIEEFIRLLPSLTHYLGGKSQVPAQFSIIGDGPMRQYVEREVARLRLESVPVNYMGETDARTLFSRASVVISLQKYTNYPSRVVAEGLLSGCFVIVRDTGESRLFGELPGLIYIDPDLRARDLASVINTSFQLLKRNPQFSTRIRNEAMKRFSTEKVLDYYTALLTSSTGSAKGHY